MIILHGAQTAFADEVGIVHGLGMEFGLGLGGVGLAWAWGWAWVWVWVIVWQSYGNGLPGSAM